VTLFLAPALALTLASTPKPKPTVILAHRRLQVAVQLSEKDVIRAHARDELGIDMDELSNPWAAAGASAVAFVFGAGGWSWRAVRPGVGDNRSVNAVPANKCGSVSSVCAASSRRPLCGII